MAPKRNAFSNGERLALRAEHSKRPKLSQKELCVWFEAQFKKPIKQSTVCETLGERWSHLESSSLSPGGYRRLNNRTGQWQELEKALVEWQLRVGCDVTITSDVLKKKALEFWRLLPCYKDLEPPKLSNGWLYNFQKRHGVTRRRQHAGPGSGPVNDAELMEEINSIQLQLSAFAPQDRYNANVTGLFYKLRPSGGLTSAQNHGHKKDKARVSLLFACNADGTHKMKPWVIGKFEKPRALELAGVSINNLDCIYRSNNKAYTNAHIFKEYLKWFDGQMNGRKVVLLMDNKSAHVAAVDLLQDQPSSFKNTVIIFLSKNLTSKTEPLDQGIIRTFKAFYRQQWLIYVLEEWELSRDACKTVDVLKVMRWIIRAWSEVKPVTIAHCWQYCDLYTANSGTPCIDQSPPLPEGLEQQLSSSVKLLRQRQLIPQATSVEQLLNPEEERVVDGDEDMTQSEQDSEQAGTDDEDTEGEELIRITTQQAIQLLNQLRLSEEQSVECSQDFIEVLYNHEKVLRARQLKNSRQTDLRAFF